MTPQQSCYHARKAAGICPYCGSEPARPGVVYCEKCANFFKNSYRIRKNANRSKGLCACGNIPTPGMKMYSGCRGKQTEANKRWLKKKGMKHSRDRSPVKGGERI